MLTAINTITVLPVRVCRIDEISPGMGRAFTIGQRSIAVFRNRTGVFQATDNACPHAGAPLADGILADNCIVCPYHARRFDLKSGKCEGHALRVTPYAVSLHDGWVFVGVPKD
jgi:NAD(P)H-dependent nitrite reductase small subunit